MTSISTRSDAPTSVARDAGRDRPVTPLIGTPPALALLAVLVPVAWWAAPKVTFRLAKWLPAAMTVRSGGTTFPSLLFALPFTIRASALVFLATGVVAAVSPWPWRRKWPSWVTPACLVVLVLVAAAIYGYLGYPHNAGPANSRIHWVDIYFSRVDEWWYTLVKLPHRIFYDAPYLLQALNGAVNVALMYVVGRTLFKRGPLPLVFALTYLASSIMLAFADTAEDVQLNVAALLIAYLLYLRRSTPWFGVSLFVVVLGRPQLGYLGAACLFTEFCFPAVTQPAMDAPALPTRLWARAKALRHDRFVVVNVVVAAVVFLLWDAFLVARGQNWLLHNGRLFDAGLDQLKPIAKDGFTISAFSGAYLLHALWIFPAAMIVAAAVALWRVRDMPLVAKRALVFAMFVVVGGIAISESQPLYYFNFRYLAYLFPFLTVAAFTVLTIPTREGSTRRPWFGPAAVATLLCLSAVTPYWLAPDERNAMLANPIAHAFPDRGEIRRIVGDAPAGTTSARTGVQYTICYLLRRPPQRVRILDRRRLRRFHGYVFANPGQVKGGEVVYDAHGVVIVRLP